MEEEKTVKKEAKELTVALHNHTKDTIEALTDEQALEMLRLKWIVPLVDGINSLPAAVVEALTKRVEALSKKYATTLNDIDAELQTTEAEFCAMLDGLTGNEYDLKGLAELKKLLGGDKNA